MKQKSLRQHRSYECFIAFVGNPAHLGAQNSLDPQSKELDLPLQRLQPREETKW